MSLIPIPAPALVWAAALFNYAEVSLSWLLGWAKKVVAAWNALTKPADYVFFEGSLVPYPLNATAYYATGSAAPELLYCADTKTFYPFVPRTEASALKETMAHRLSCPTVLSIELVDGEGRVAYDLTDFLETVRIADVEGYPTPTLYHYLSAWTLSSQIVPDYNRLGVRYIDGNGESHQDEPGTESQAEQQPVVDAEPEPEQAEQQSVIDAESALESPTEQAETSESTENKTTDAPTDAPPAAEQPVAPAAELASNA